MSVLDLEIAKLARDNYLIAGLREKVSLWTEDDLLLVYNRLLAVYDSAYIENVDLKNKPKALKLLHKSINLMGLGHLAQFSDAMLDPHKASRIFSAVDDKITARYGKGTAQRNRNIMKQEDIKCKKNPKQHIISTTNVENVPPTNSNPSACIAPKWEVIDQEKFVMGTPSNIPAPNVILVPPKGQEIQRTPLRPANTTSFVISPPNAFKTPSVVVSKCSVSGKIIPAGSKIPRTPEGEVQFNLTMDKKFDSLPTGHQLPRTPLIESSSNSNTQLNLPIKGKELARTPVGSVSDANESKEVRDTFEIPPKRMELSRTPDNFSSEKVESYDKRSTFDIPMKGNQLARTPTNDSILANDSSNKRSTFDISLKGNQLARTPISTSDDIQANDKLSNRRSTFDIPVEEKELDDKSISGGSQINNPSSNKGGQLSKSTNLSAENTIPRGRQLSRTPQNGDNSIDENKTCMNSTYVQNKDTEDKRNTFGVQLPSSDTTFDIFQPPIQFCDDESVLISPPSDFVVPSSNIIISKSKALNETDRRGSYLHEKCSVSDRRETFTVESDDRRGTFTVDASHDDSIFQSLDKNYVGPIPKRKEKPHYLSENNETFKSVDGNDTFVVNVETKNIRNSNSPKESIGDETCTIDQTRERLNTDDLSFFDPLADETISSGRHSLMVKTSDNKPLPTTKKLDEKPLLTAYTPELPSDTQGKRVPVSKNCIPKGRKQLPRTPTGTDDLIDLKNESSENGSSSFAVGDLTVEIFVKDKKRDSIQVDQNSNTNSRGSIGALVRKLDSKIDANSPLSNTPQKCTPALNIDTPLCSEVRNQDKKMGNVSKNILQKNVKNLLQNKLDTINDEEDDSLDIFYKKSDNSSNVKDKKESKNKLETEDKISIIERQSDEKSLANIKLGNKTSKLEKFQEKNDSDKDLVDKKYNREESSENVTNNQLENLHTNKNIVENNREADKKCKEKDAKKQTNNSNEYIKDKSNEKENLDKKTKKEINEKKDENCSDFKDTKEAKNNVNKDEKDLLYVSNISENKVRMDLEDYINLHKKPALKNFKIPKVSKQEKVEEGKGPEKTKANDETKQTVPANTEKQDKASKTKLQTLKDSEVDKNVKSNESETIKKIVKKSSKEEKPKSALDILISDLNDSSDFNDSLEIFPLKKNKVYKSHKKCEGVTEFEENKLEKDNKDMHKSVKGISNNELANEKELKEHEDNNKCASKNKAKKEPTISKPKKETKTNKKNSKITKVDQAVADKMENLIEQPNKTKDHVPKNVVINDDILEPMTDMSTKVLYLKESRESLGSILPTPMRELLRTDDNEFLESTRNQDLLTTPAITNLLVKDEYNSQVKCDDAQRKTLKINSKSKGRKLNVDIQTEEISDNSKASKLKVPIKKATKERKKGTSDHENKTDKDTAIEHVETKMDQNKDDALSRTQKQNEPTENIPDNEVKGLIDGKSKDSNKVLNKFDKKVSDDFDATEDSSSTLVQLTKKQQSKPVQRRGKNTRLSMEVIVKMKDDKDNSINKASQLELPLEENKLNKNLEESASELINTKENKKKPSIEKRGRSKTKVETAIKDVEKIKADDEQVAKTSKKPVAKRGSKVIEVEMEESIQQVSNTVKKPVAKRGRKATEIQMEESTDVEQVASTTKKPVTKRGRKVTDIQLEESIQQVEQVDSTNTKPVTKRGSRVKEVKLEESTQQVKEVANTTTKPIAKRGRKVTDVQLEESTQHEEQKDSTSTKPVSKRGRKVTEVKLEESSQVQKVAGAISKPVTKRGRKVMEVPLEELTQEDEQKASTSAKLVTKRTRKVSEVKFEESTIVEQVTSTTKKPVTKRGRKVTEVQLEESTQEVAQVASTSSKPVTKRGKKALEEHLEESSLGNEVLKPPSRGGKNTKNIDTSSISKANDNISLSKKPTPKGSRRASLLNNSTTDTSISLEPKNPRSRRGKVAVLEEPNSKLKESETSNNSKPVRGQKNISTPLEVATKTESNNTSSMSRRGKGNNSDTSEPQTEIRKGRKAIKELVEESKKTVSGKDILETTKEIDDDKQAKTVQKVVKKDEKQSKAPGRSRQVKSNVSDANESKTGILNKKENQKLKVTKENIKASTNNKRQQIEDSNSSPDKKRKIENLHEKVSTAKNVRNANVLVSEESNVDKKRKTSRTTLDTSYSENKRRNSSTEMLDKSAVENIKTVKRKASKETLDTSSVESIKPVKGRKRVAKVTDEECSPVKKGKVLKKPETNLNENISAAATSGRGSRKCKTAASTAIKDIANATADLSLTKRKSRKT